MIRNDLAVLGKKTDEELELLTVVESSAMKSMLSQRDTSSAALATAQEGALVASAERDTAIAAQTTAEAERDALRSQLDAILNPPDGIYPYQFQRLLTDDQLVAIQLSIDPPLIRMRTDVQTIVSPMPFGEGSNLRNGVKYLGYVLPELFTPDEVTRIINRQPPV